jgi:hypothetical protein
VPQTGCESYSIMDPAHKRYLDGACSLSMCASCAAG